MTDLVRAFLALVAFAASFFFSFWVIFGQILPLEIASLPALVAAVWVAGFVWRQTGRASAGLFPAIASGAALLGSVGFVAGFFGPMVLTPEANQGPLLGILITGPLGFLAGAVLGAGWWCLRPRLQPG